MVPLRITPVASYRPSDNYPIILVNRRNMAEDEQSQLVIPPDDDRDFFPYPRDENTFEDLDKYRGHGLHPVILGEILPKPSTCVSHPDR